jgi:hypothetical protein
MCPETLLHTIFIERGEGNASRDSVLLYQHEYNFPPARILSPFGACRGGGNASANAYVKDLV